MSGAREANILFTCVGRRVALVESFRQAAEELGISCCIVGTDASELAPAVHVCDKHVITKAIDDPDHIPHTVAIASEYEIDLVVPTIDTELKLLAAAREQFEAVGTKVLISSPQVVDICQDKRKAYRFLLDHGFGTPRTWSADDSEGLDPEFPVFLKPWDGSASKGNAVARDREQLEYWTKSIPNCLVQEYISAVEYTCDAYVDFDMRVRCVVPRKRIEVRAGEVSKGQTVKLPELIRQCERLVDALQAGPGVITIQCFLVGDNEVRFIEINPRFGGGVPLSIRAGANFPKWLLQELIGEKPEIEFAGWEDGLCMLRYDQAIWYKGDDKPCRGRENRSL